MSKTEEYLDYYENRIKEDREASFFIFLTALSKDSDNPQNVFLRGDSGIGKTWVVTNILELFNDSNIWMLGGLSPTALVHSYGDLQDEHGHPFEWTEKPTLAQVKEEMQFNDPSVSKSNIEKEYFERLKNWNEKLKKSKYVVDLNGKLLVFLDAPHIKTFDALRPVLSHDKYEISYRFTDKSAKGQLRTQHVVLRGFPSTIFCTTSRAWLEDLATRSLTITPKTTNIKLRAACILIGEDAAFPMNNHEQKEAALMKLKLQCLQNDIKDNLVAVPFGPQMGEVIPLNQPRVMRDFKHLVTYIKLNALCNHKHRPKIFGFQKTIILATYEDFETVMQYFRYCEETTTTGLNQHILNVFHKTMIPLKTFTYSDLVNKCKEVLDRPLSESTLRVYVSELQNISYVSEETHPTDKRRKIIRVIKKEEKALDYIRNEFKAWFTLESFKGWLNSVRKNTAENPILLNNIPSDKWDNDVESLFYEHYIPQEEATIRENGKTEGKNVTDFQPSLEELSLNEVGNSNVTETNAISLTPVLEAEKCEQCNEFPVAYEFPYKEQKIRRCKNCIGKMQRAGLKFTTLKEVEG